MSALANIFARGFGDYRPAAQRVMRRVHAIQSAVSGGKPVPVKEPNHYDFYPWLFAGAFPPVTPPQLETIAVSGILYLRHLLILDKVFDSDGATDKYRDRLFLGAMLHERSVLAIAELCPPCSEFWAHLQEYEVAFAAANMREKKSHHRRVSAYEPDEFRELAAGKAALSKGTTTALAYVANRVELIVPFSLSQDAFNAAIQIFDDIKDWKEDFRSGRYSLLLTRALLESGIDGAALSGEKDCTDELGRHLYYSEIMEECLCEAVRYCDEAIEHARDLNAEGWVKLNNLLKSDLGALGADLRQIRLRTVIRSKGFLSSGIDSLLTTSISYLLAQQRAGYPEAVHAMGFSLIPGAGDDLYTGCVFQRAIILDVLLDLRERGLLPREAVISEEIESLIAARLTHVNGGWSYFPALRNLAPDSDDLGQILQVLVRAGFTPIGPLVDDSIRLLLEKNRHSDGSFETLIVDRDATDEASKEMARAIDVYWGGGADVEVVANMAYGLYLYAPSQYEDAIDEAAAWVENLQCPGGMWKPTWYATTFYGTYAATRLLSAVRPGSPALKATAAFIENAQRPDGGFGDNRSTALETALALLTNALLPENAGRSSLIFPAAFRYLQLTCGEHGSWDAAEFIKMEADRLKRPPGTPSQAVITYKSRAISTAYVAKALLSEWSAPASAVL